MKSNPAITLTAPADVYRRRRASLAGQLDRPMVVCAGYAAARNYAANAHPLRAGSTYLYYGGPPLEGAAWVIQPGSDGDEGCTLLRPAPGPDDAVWMGPTPSDKDVCAAAGLRAAGLADVDQLAPLLAGRVAPVIAPPCLRTHAWTSAVGLEPPQPDELLAVIEMRLIKDAHELAAMRRAAEVSVAAHRAAMAATAPGRREADVAAAFRSVLVADECQPSFTPIVTVRGEVLHG
ncbi:MAG: aminopeptidase P N-terminal domain-containing protein, partial [Planctomycetota bacterium]